MHVAFSDPDTIYSHPLPPGRRNEVIVRDDNRPDEVDVSNVVSCRLSRLMATK